MKIKVKIRQDVSQVLDTLIPENRWNEYIEMLDRDGHPNRRELLSLIVTFAKHIETLENTLEDMAFQIDLLEGNTQSIKPIEAPFKLRTAIDVQKELEASKTLETKQFTVSSDDFALLEQLVDAKDPEKGYGKEIDQLDGKEKVCLFYLGLPVFRK